MRKIFDVILSRNPEKGERFLKELEGKTPLFVCTIGTTDTAKIPNLSIAGENPDLTDYTPPADAEFLVLGSCKSIPGVPITPDGIPTPGLTTRAALRLSGIPVVVASGGLRIKPQIPFIELGGEQGRDIRAGKALSNAGEVYDRAFLMGENLGKSASYLVVGESVPAGTTTALGVLLAMGVPAENKVSSSMPLNPHNLKMDTVKAGMTAAGIEFGSLKNDPLKAASCLGDPMMPAAAGLIAGAASKVPVIMAGGTQMGAVLAIVGRLKGDVTENLAIGTTRWIVEDKKSDLNGIVSCIADIPVLAADLDYSESKYPGLRAYEQGIAKEGVGCGGVSIAAMAMSKGSITKDGILRAIESEYEKLRS